MGMNSIFKGSDQRWWYAILDENGKSVCMHIIADPLLEKEFMVYLNEVGDEPDKYTIYELNRFYEKFVVQKLKAK